MDTRKGIAVLGSTGSIGVNTLSVVASHPDRFAVLALAAHSNVDKLEEQVRRFRPRLAVLFDAERAAHLRERLGDLDIEVDSGLEGLCRAAVYPDVDLVMIEPGWSDHSRGLIHLTVAAPGPLPETLAEDLESLAAIHDVDCTVHIRLRHSISAGED